MGRFCSHSIGQNAATWAPNGKEGWEMQSHCKSGQRRPGRIPVSSCSPEPGYSVRLPSHLLSTLFPLYLVSTNPLPRPLSPARPAHPPTVSSTRALLMKSMVPDGMWGTRKRSTFGQLLAVHAQQGCTTLTISVSQPRPTGCCWTRGPVRASSG